MGSSGPRLCPPGGNRAWSGKLRGGRLLLPLEVFFKKDGRYQRLDLMMLGQSRAHDVAWKHFMAAAEKARKFNDDLIIEGFLAQPVSSIKDN